MSTASDVLYFLENNGIDYTAGFEHKGVDFIDRDAATAFGVFDDTGEPFSFLNGDFDEERLVSIQISHHNPETAEDLSQDIIEFLHTNFFTNQEQTYNYAHIINTALPQKQEMLDNGNVLIYFNFQIIRRKI